MTQNMKRPNKTIRRTTKVVSIPA